MVAAGAPRRAAETWGQMVEGNPVLTVVDTLLRSTGQVMFQNNPLTGLIFLAGIFVNSGKLGGLGILGLATSTLTAYLLGADRTLIRNGLFGFNGILVGIGLAIFHGLYGFNSVLTGIALGGLFYVLTWRSAIYALVAAIITALVFAAIAVFLAPIGMPALTAPFVLVTWIFLWAKAGFKALVPMGLDDVTTAEAHLEGYRTGGAGPAAPARGSAP